MVIVQSIIREDDDENPGFAAQFIVCDKIFRDYWIHPSPGRPGSRLFEPLCVVDPPPSRPVG